VLDGLIERLDALGVASISEVIGTLRSNSEDSIS
jgi:hypothetical protein